MILALVLIAGAMAIVAAHALILLTAMWGDRLTSLAIARGRAVAPLATARLARLLPRSVRGKA